MSRSKTSDLLRADHRRMENYLDGLLSALKHLDADRLSDVRRNFLAIQPLAHLHLEQEEQVFYPEVRAAGPELLTQMDGQHQDIRETEQWLAELLASFPSSPSERDLVELHRLGIEFHDAVQVHIIEEEDKLLALADSYLSEMQQEQLYATMQAIAAQSASPPGNEPSESA